ncbi:MAG: DUF2851 family protein, partial [Bacteroidales bacterium]|nr:DUF2851 family protein [Bacteroidales bacterium]
MSEDFLHFIWRNGLWDYTFQKFADGREFEVIDRGTLNFDAGPDFFNAKIKIENTIWAGNIEIHTKSSQWYSHNHHLDDAYDNVILHVVHKHDKEVYNKNGEIIPVFEMKIPEYITRNYKELSKELNWPACNKQINKLDENKIKFWLERIGVERLEYKTQLVKQLFTQFNGDWEATWFQFLASALGFKVNKEPFALLMQRTPFKILQKESHNLFNLEALLFGQSGMLDIDCHEEYFVKLKDEYKFLKHKYNLIGMPEYLWKFSRMRPFNFPSLRIAQ